MKKNNKIKLKKIIFSLTPLFAFLFSVGLLILGVKSYLNNASYFEIKKVTINGLEDKELAQNISRRFLYNNIFKLDIKKIREDLKITNPNFYDVDAIRNFPDHLIINVIVRKPLAQIKQKGFFLVDSEGVIVSDMSKEAFDNNIIISGLRAEFSLSFGKKINLEELRSALRLAQALKDIKQELSSFILGLSNDKIEIVISRYPSLYVYLNKLETRFYDDGLDKRLRLLMEILPTLNKKIEQVEYIDLRFLEPVVSFKK